MTTADLNRKLNTFDRVLEQVERQLNNLADYTKQVTQLVQRFDAQLVSYENMQNAPYYVALEIDKGVVSYRIPAPEGMLTFVVTFKNRALLRKHKHDCKELIYKLAGDLMHHREKVDTTLEIPPGEEHPLMSNAGCLLVVHFEKP